MHYVNKTDQKFAYRTGENSKRISTKLDGNDDVVELDTEARLNSQA